MRQRENHKKNDNDNYKDKYKYKDKDKDLAENDQTVQKNVDDPINVNLYAINNFKHIFETITTILAQLPFIPVKI